MSKQAVLDASDMAAALLSEPDGLAAIIIADTGIAGEDLHAALATSVASCDAEPTASRLQALQFTDDAMAALRGTHAATLRLGHNYVGTEHLLLGILSTDSPTASTLDDTGPRRPPRGARDKRRGCTDPGGARPRPERNIAMTKAFGALHPAKLRVGHRSAKATTPRPCHSVRWRLWTLRLTP